jgi:hypothetical protein
VSLAAKQEFDLIGKAQALGLRARKRLLSHLKVQSVTKKSAIIYHVITHYSKKKREYRKFF